MPRGRKIHRGDLRSWRTQGSVAAGRVRRKIAEGTRAVSRTGSAFPGGGETPGISAAHGPEHLHKRGGLAS